jgi:hypothetical protein
MKTKFLSLLFIALLVAGVTSCSKDNSSAAQSGYDAGKSAGATFLNTYNACKSGDPATQAIQGINLYNAYTDYKTKSTNPEWKKGFLEGVSPLSDTQQQLGTLLDNANITDPANIITLISSLTNILK